MPFTPRDWEEAKKRQRLQREATRVSQYQALAQAEVGAAQLTNHAAWNWFLQILSAEKGKAAAALAGVDEKARSGLDFSPETLSRVQAARLMYAERIKTYEEVMEIPKQIVDDSKRAQAMLKELNRAKLQEKSSGPAAS